MTPSDQITHRQRHLDWSSRTRSARTRSEIGIIGLGYVGLPLAVEFAQAGFDVTGFDIDAPKVADSTHGALLHPRTSTARDRADLVGSGRLRATTDFARPRRHGRHQHLRADAAAEDEGPRPLLHRRARSRRSRAHLRPGQLDHPRVAPPIPGTTEEVVQPMLEADGLKRGRRLLPGVLARARRSGRPAVPHRLEHPEGRRRHRPPRCTELATALYGQIVSTVVPVSARRKSPRWSSCSRTRSAR